MASVSMRSAVELCNGAFRGDWANSRGLRGQRGCGAQPHR